MKLKVNDLSSHLKTQLLPVYLITGDEILLVNEAYDALKQAAVKAGYDERLRFTVDTHFDWDAFTGESQHLSLFSTQRILDLELPTGKPGDAGSKTLQAYCHDLPPDTLLLIRAPKLPAASLSSRWVKAIESVGGLIQVYPLDKQLPGWIANRARERGLELSQETVHWLASQTENNGLAAAQEIEKLTLFFGKGPITQEQVMEAISDHSRYDNFQLIDHALKKEPHKVVKILDALHQSGEHPSLILWAITRELRLLAQLAFSMGQGESFHSACQQHRVWSTKQPLLQIALQTRTAAFFHQGLSQCRKIDAMIKGQEPGHCWDALLDVLLRLCTTPQKQTKRTA